MGSVSDSVMRRNPRPRLLHSWGASLLAIAHKMYGHAEHLNGPVGFIARALASAANPILDPIQHKWLSVLSFVDGQILFLEDLTVSVFPPSSYLFVMVDELALLADSFPKQLDDGIDALASMIQQFPLYEPVLKPMLVLVGVGSGEWRHGECKEEYAVDIKCEEEEKNVIMPKEGAEDGDGVPLMEEAGDEIQKKMSKEAEEEMREVEDTCKDIIEELEKMGMVNKEDGDGVSGGHEEEKGVKRLEEEEEEEEVDVVAKDAILAFFDEGWGVKK